MVDQIERSLNELYADPERADAMGAGTTTNAPAVAPTTGRIDRDALQQR